ncbi:MAG: hypothetical protein O3A82_00790 [Verrucomicrobia bacterium]|nr:hypothetical protein [Verrucomicrobiota bacterium]MDA0724353.1 hypothetical protein [Verrucomicrobiota bacterium]MDA1045448.1 hypothetical protein [Verrucomicrobiota bacterium]
MKNFPLLLGLVAPFFFSGCGGESSSPVNDANSSSAVETSTTNIAAKPPKLSPLVPTIELTGAETQPFAYLKTIALPKLLLKAVAVAQAVKPDPQIAMLPALAGMVLGDLSLASIDANASMTLFVFDEFGGDPTFVLAVKLSKDSPIRKQAENFKLVMVDQDGWTLATRAPELLSQVKDWSPLISFAEQAPEGDLEAGIRFAPVWAEMPKIKALAEGGLAASPLDDDTKASFGKLIGISLDEVATLDSAKINLLLSTEEILARSTLSAKDGSALSALFSSKGDGGEVTVAKYVESGGLIDVVTNLDMVSYIEYIEHILGKVTPLFQGEFKELLERYEVLIADLAKLYGGQTAIRYDFSAKPAAMNIVQVGSSKASSEEIGKMFTDYMKLTQDMFEKIDFLKSLGVKYEFNFEKGEPVEGIPTHRFSMKMDVEEADPSLFPAGLPYSNMTYLYAVTNGHYVVAMDKEQLGGLLRTLKAGTPVENSLAENLKLEPGQMARWSMDVGKYAKLIIGSMGDTLLDEESTKRIVEGISKLDFAPVTGSISVGDGRFSTDVKIPLKTIKAGVDYFESEKAALQAEAIPDKIPASSPKVEEEAETEKEN